MEVDQTQHTPSKLTYYVYILKCSDGSYYTGHTDDLEMRVELHRSGGIPGYTSTRLPVELVFSETLPSRVEAIERELQIKRWTRKKKEALIRGDWDRLEILAKPPALRLGSGRTDRHREP